MKYPMGLVLGLAYLIPGWQGPAQADFLLSFGSPNYTVGPGRTVQVQVFGSQNANGTQITAVNGLTLAGIVVSFNTPSGVAAVTSMSNIVGGPAFDFSTPSLTSTQASVTDVSLALAGVGTLPVLLGTFTFNGLHGGATQITVAPISPGLSFAAAISGSFQPTSTATATINVTPEPTSLLVMLTGAPVLLGVVALQRRRSRIPSKYEH